jgi:hypothetical protein
MLRPSARTQPRHPVNIALDTGPPFGGRIADRVTTFIRRWGFLVPQTILLTIWIGGKIALLFHYDPYPIILLSLAFSPRPRMPCRSSFWPMIAPRNAIGRRSSAPPRRPTWRKRRMKRSLTGIARFSRVSRRSGGSILALEGQIKAAVERFDGDGRDTIGRD